MAIAALVNTESFLWLAISHLDANFLISAAEERAQSCHADFSIPYPRALLDKRLKPGIIEVRFTIENP